MSENQQTWTFEEVLAKPNSFRGWHVATYIAKGWIYPKEGVEKTEIVYITWIGDEGIYFDYPVSESGVTSSGSFSMGLPKDGGAHYGGQPRVKNLRIRPANPEEYEGLRTWV